MDTPLQQQLLLIGYLTQGVSLYRKHGDHEYEIVQYQGDHHKEYTVYQLNGRIRDGPAELYEEGMAFQTFSVKWPKAENLDFPSGQTLVRASILLVFCLETTFVFLHYSL